MTFVAEGHIFKSREAADDKSNAHGAKQGDPVGIFPSHIGMFHAFLNHKKGNHAMTKSLEVISEAVRNPKHPFRKVDNQPKKPLKHRYERRKIKEYLHLGEWIGGEAS